MRNRLSHWLAEPALCAAWMARTAPAQRWELFAALRPRDIGTLRRTSDALQAVHAALLPKRSAAERQRSHWQFLSGYVFAADLPIAPAMLARRYAIHLCREQNAGVATGMATTVARGMASGMALGMAPVMAPGMAQGMTAGPASSGMAPGMTAGMASGMAQGAAAGMAAGKALRMAPRTAPDKNVRTASGEPARAARAAFTPSANPIQGAPLRQWLARVAAALSSLRWLSFAGTAMSQAVRMLGRAPSAAERWEVLQPVRNAIAPPPGGPTGRSAGVAGAAGGTAGTAEASVSRRTPPAHAVLSEAPHPEGRHLAASHSAVPPSAVPPSAVPPSAARPWGLLLRRIRLRGIPITSAMPALYCWPPTRSGCSPC